MVGYSAGIIPFSVNVDQEIVFLLGYENNKWSGFVGHSEKNENVVNTAIREFNEETAMIFSGLSNYIRSKINNKLCYFYKDYSYKNNDPVYLWFVEIPVDTNINSQFIKNKEVLNKPEFKEKEKLQWFLKSQINDNPIILGKLRKAIKNLFH
jgi:hypothetical protein